ncbi:MAG TPA: hypothetical protein VK968_05295 [Roseimicrobium sp.]|nr:hypothetical protein [Roseimicrobium sp.]
MIIHIWLLLIAVLLLWIPRQWLRYGGKVVTLPERSKADKDIRDANDVSLQLRDEILKPRNWVDFLRAAAGGIAVYGVCFEVGQGAAKGTGNIVFIVQFAVLLIAVLLQTIRIEQRMTLVAPVFFVLGLSFGLIGWKAALFACVTIWVLNLLLPSAGMFLFVFAFVEAVFFRLVGNGFSMKTVILTVILTTFPLLFSALTNRRLVRLNKKNRTRSSKGA